MAVDLLEQIDFSGLNCLNEQPKHPATNALKQGYREDDGMLSLINLKSLLYHLQTFCTANSRSFRSVIQDYFYNQMQMNNC
jgi:hypothetical protein